MHPTPETGFKHAQQHTRRLLDHPDATLTITYAQLADALQRTMLCQVPAIVQGVWNVLQHEHQQREQAQREALTAQTRALRQQQLEAAFGGGL